MTIDYERKSALLREGLPSIVKEVEKALYADYALSHYGQYVRTTMNKATADNLWSFLVSERFDDYKECIKINRADYERQKRLRRRITAILSCGDCLFLTLTFTDKTLSNTTAATRRRYVSRFLRNCGGVYVANVDYGAKNGREHYHAVISSSSIDFKPWHEYGAINSRIIHCVEKDGFRYKADVARLSKYVAKLTNHAIKTTTKRSALLCARD